MYTHYGFGTRQGLLGFWDVDISAGLSEQEIFWSEQGVLREGNGQVLGQRFSDLRESRSLLFKFSLWSEPRRSWPFRSRPAHGVQMQARRTIQSFYLVDDALPAIREVCMPVTGRCNLSCVMCTRTKRAKYPLMKLTFREEDLPKAISDKVAALAPQLDFVDLLGFGEPLMSQSLFPMVAELKTRMQPHARISIATNGTLLYEHACRQILEMGVDIVTVSIDGATPEIYGRIRRHGRLDDVKANISRLVEWRAERGLTVPKLRAHFVIMKQNYHEIVDIVRLVHALHMQEVVFGLEFESASRLPRSVIEQLLDEAVAVGSQFGVKVMRHFRVFPSGGEQISDHDHVRLIRAYHKRIAEILTDSQELWVPGSNDLPYDDGSEHSSDTGDSYYCAFMECLQFELSGDINPCPYYWNENTLTLKQRFGNANTQDFGAIWNSRTYATFRRRVINQQWPAVCSACCARLPRRVQ